MHFPVALCGMGLGQGFFLERVTFGGRAGYFGWVQRPRREERIFWLFQIFFHLGGSDIGDDTRFEANLSTELRHI